MAADQGSVPVESLGMGKILDNEVRQSIKPFSDSYARHDYGIRVAGTSLQNTPPVPTGSNTRFQQ
eukprot:8381315-Pyramimonas_sp.AAC.1